MRKRVLSALPVGIVLSMVFIASSSAMDCQYNPDYIRGDIWAAQYPIPPLWSPDGQQVLFNADARIHAVATDGSDLYTFPHRGEWSVEHAVSISPDGEAAFTQFELRQGFSAGPEYEIATASLDGSNRRTLAKDTGLSFPTWSLDGSHIAFAQRVSVETPDGRRNALRGLRTMRKDGSGMQTYYRPPDRPPELQVALLPQVWSPDGRTLALLLERRRGNCYPSCYLVIYAFDVDGSHLERVAETASLPAWSPDGSRIAFIQRNDGAETIATIRPDGSDLRRIAAIPKAVSEYPMFRSRGSFNHVTWQRASDYPPGRVPIPEGRWVSWSRDGSEIRVHLSPFITVDADGSDMRIMWAPPGARAAWSPDESRIAVYLPDSPDGVGLLTMAPDGSDRRILVSRSQDGERWEAFSGNGVPALAPPTATQWPVATFQGYPAPTSTPAGMFYWATWTQPSNEELEG